MTKIVPKKATTDWTRWAEMLAKVESPELRKAPGECLRKVLAEHYEAHLEENYEHARRRRDDIEQLAGYADQFKTTTEFLSQLALQTNLEAEQEQNRPQPGEADERVRLSTVHQAKGLEYGAVFVMMLCDGLFPNARAIEQPDGEEEERRLFYVAVTRAKRELYLCRPLLRFMPGGGDAMQMPSRFLAEVAPELLEEINVVSPSYSSGGGGRYDAPDEATQPDAPAENEPF